MATLCRADFNLAGFNFHKMTKRAGFLVTVGGGGRGRNYTNCVRHLLLFSLILCQEKYENNCRREQDKTKCFLIQRINTFILSYEIVRNRRITYSDGWASK